MKTSEAPVIVSTTIHAPISKVWKAISELPLMHQWYFEAIPVFKAEVDFETSFSVHNEERTFTHNWKINTVIPEKQLSYQWNYLEYDGDSIVHFKLAEKDKQTTSITIEVEVLEDFSDEIPEFKRESCVGGWTYFIPGRLKSFLERE